MVDESYIRYFSSHCTKQSQEELKSILFPNTLICVIATVQLNRFNYSILTNPLKALVVNFDVILRFHQVQHLKGTHSAYAAIIFLHYTNSFAFTTDMERVYCKVRAECLNCNSRKLRPRRDKENAHDHITDMISLSDVYS